MKDSTIFQPGAEAQHVFEGQQWKQMKIVAAF
jgi:hypothetical protein